MYIRIYIGVFKIYIATTEFHFRRIEVEQISTGKQNFSEYLCLRIKVVSHKTE